MSLGTALGCGIQALEALEGTTFYPSGEQGSDREETVQICTASGTSTETSSQETTPRGELS